MRYLDITHMKELLLLLLSIVDLMSLYYFEHELLVALEPYVQLKPTCLHSTHFLTQYF